MRANSDALLHVDAVSATGAIDTQMDAWGLDTVCTASQKALMGPPGLSLVAVSERARKVSETCANRALLLRLEGLPRITLRRYETPSTTAISVIYGLAAAAEMILAEGVANVYARHESVAAFTRERVRGLGLEVFAVAGYSPTLTAVRMPEGINGDDVRIAARDQGVEFGGIWGRLQGKILRIGHMGATSHADIDQAIEVLGDVMAQMRADPSKGTLST